MDTERSLSNLLCLCWKCLLINYILLLLNKIHIITCLILICFQQIREVIHCGIYSISLILLPFFFFFLSFSLLWAWNVHMWKKGQTWLSFYRCHLFCFMRQGLLLPWVSPGTVGTNRGSQGPACLYYSRAEITRFAILLCLASSLFFHMDLGD